MSACCRGDGGSGRREWLYNDQSMFCTVSSFEPISSRNCQQLKNLGLSVSAHPVSRSFTKDI